MGEYLTDHEAHLAKVKKRLLTFLVPASCENGYEASNYLEGSSLLSQ